MLAGFWIDLIETEKKAPPYWNFTRRSRLSIQSNIAHNFFLGYE